MRVNHSNPLRAALAILAILVLSASAALPAELKIVRQRIASGAEIMHGGSFQASVTLGQTEAAGRPAQIASGGTFELTSGYARRASAALPDAIFSANFE